METNNAPGLVLVRIGEDYNASVRKVYEVPENVYLSRGQTVLIRFCDKECTGICMTDTVYPDDETYDMMCKAFVVPRFPTVSARMTIQRFDEPKGG